MKKIISVLVFAITTLSAQGQSFDDVKSRYEADSIFSISLDSMGYSFVEINPITVFGTTYTSVRFSVYNDYGTQPYEILPQRDSAGVKLKAVLGVAYCANASFTLCGPAGGLQQSIAVNDINSNAHAATLKYTIKFLYWYFSDKFGLTLK